MTYKNIFSKGKAFFLAGILLGTVACENELEEYWKNEIPDEVYVTDASVSSNSIQHGETVTFTDLSTDVLSREWTFAGGNPGTSTDQVVDVTYNVGGTYKATLKVTHLDNLPTVMEFDIAVEGPVMLAWGGTPAPIPGIVEFENYDIGGEGVSYHDTEPENKADGEHTYRSDDGIDIEVGDERTNIGYSNADEWMEYTVNIESAAAYDFDFILASGSSDGGGSVKIQLKNEDGTYTDLGETGDFENTGGWSAYTSLVVAGIDLPAGEQILRFYLTGGGVNLDKVEISSDAVVSTDKYGIYTERATVLGSVGELTMNENQGVAISTVADAAEGTEATLFGFAWADGVWGYMTEILPTAGPVDLSEFANGYYNISIKTTSPGKMKLRFQSDGVQGYVWLDDAVKTYGLERDGQWHTLKIPMADFRVDASSTGANPDFSAITHLMVLRSEGGVAEGEDWDWYVDDIYLTKE